MNITIADQRAWLRSALRLYLEYEFDIGNIYEVENFDDLLPQLALTQPDLLLLDWELPGLQGQKASAESIDLLRAACPELRITAMSAQLEAEQLAQTAGVDGFISKTEPPQRLLRELDATRQQQGLICPLPVEPVMQ